MKLHKLNTAQQLLVTFAALVLITGTISIYTASPVYAQEGKISEQQIDEIKARIEATRARLNLSEAQRAALQPILKADLEARRDVLQDYGFREGERPKLSLRKKLKLRNKMNDIRKTSLPKIEQILDADQYAEYLKIQDEARERFRARM